MADKQHTLCDTMSASLSDEVLTLNVGGVLYTTTRSTLTKYADSMLGAMFGNRFAPSPPSLDRDGNHFIDRDGYMFRHVLNFLRTGHLCLPHGFKDFDLLEAEADFYQVVPLVTALKSIRSRSTSSNAARRPGFYLEMLDFEETAYFYRFYSDPPRGINAELKNSGLVISGARQALLMLPLPEKTMRDLRVGDAEYRSVNVTAGGGAKMALMHHLQASGWQLLTTSFANSTNSDGSYMVHKYMWYLSKP